MGLGGWLRENFGTLFGGKGASQVTRMTPEMLRQILLRLDLEEKKWKDAARHAETRKQELYVSGLKPLDDRHKLECARNINRLNVDIKHYDDLIANLEKQKDLVNDRIRAMEAGEVAPDTAKITALEKAIEQSTAEYQVSQKRLEEAEVAATGVGGVRFDSALQDSPDVENIFKTLKTPMVENPPKIEKE